jgi:isopentenyl-diphosphate delta-isomerase
MNNVELIQMKNINQRKLDHVNLVADHDDLDRGKAYFDNIHLIHRALPNLDFKKLNTSVSFLGKELSFPLLISSMTGGSDADLVKINRNLAEAAEAENVAFAVGSQRVQLKDKDAKKSFNIRDIAPNILLLANIGAVQLNYGITHQECNELINSIDADGIYLHLNSLQEVIQPEGDTNFQDLDVKIKELINILKKPILIKEVGCGFSDSDFKVLSDIGIKYIDISGSGGTSWSYVESKRSNNSNLGELFKDWGVPTPIALKLSRPYKDKFTFISSGGVRNGIDMVKSLVLGASLCGLAKPFLKPAQESVDAVRKEIKILKEQFSIAQFLLGVLNAEDLINREDLIIHEDRN